MSNELACSWWQASAQLLLSRYSGKVSAKCLPSTHKSNQQGRNKWEGEGEEGERIKGRRERMGGMEKVGEERTRRKEEGRGRKKERRGREG